MSPFYGLLVLNFRKIRKSNLHDEVKREKQWLGCQFFQEKEIILSIVA
jgi:hypothetical protein